jgi:hypothetical protein
MVPSPARTAPAAPAATTATAPASPVEKSTVDGTDPRSVQPKTTIMIKEGVAKVVRVLVRKRVFITIGITTIMIIVTVATDEVTDGCG